MASYAHLALQDLHIPPGDFYRMSPREKAFLIASIDVRIEDLKKAESKIKTK